MMVKTRYISIILAVAKVAACGVSHCVGVKCDHLKWLFSTFSHRRKNVGSKIVA